MRPVAAGLSILVFLAACSSGGDSPGASDASVASEGTGDVRRSRTTPERPMQRRTRAWPTTRVPTRALSKTRTSRPATQVSCAGPTTGGATSTRIAAAACAKAFHASAVAPPSSAPRAIEGPTVVQAWGAASTPRDARTVVDTRANRIRIVSRLLPRRHLCLASNQTAFLRIRCMAFSPATVSTMR
jgi:hypothetical protein